jgi:hypothetical protein
VDGECGIWRARQDQPPLDAVSRQIHEADVHWTGGASGRDDHRLRRRSRRDAGVVYGLLRTSGGHDVAPGWHSLEAIRSRGVRLRAALSLRSRQ